MPRNTLFISGFECARIALCAFAINECNKKLNGLIRGKECETLTSKQGYNPTASELATRIRTTDGAFRDTPEWLKSRSEKHFLKNTKTEIMQIKIGDKVRFKNFNTLKKAHPGRYLWRLFELSNRTATIIDMDQKRDWFIVDIDVDFPVTQDMFRKMQ